MPSTKWRRSASSSCARSRAKELVAGQVGYLAASIKTISDTRCGDTITLKGRPCAEPLPGLREAKPVVFSSIYPVAADDYVELATAIESFELNDASHHLREGHLGGPGIRLPLPGFWGCCTWKWSRNAWSVNTGCP